MDALSRQQFLSLPWPEQKEYDLRQLFDPGTTEDLMARCVLPLHNDSSPSMRIYSNGAYCFGCGKHLWPDQLVRTLGDLPLVTERGARRLEPPKYIPLAQVTTYRDWLWGKDGHYQDRWFVMQARGLSPAHCVDNFIGHTGEAFTIPVFDERMNVLCIRYRRDDGLAHEDRPKYWGMGGANKVLLYQPVRNPQVVLAPNDVVLCEGELDALLLAQYGHRAVSLTNGCNALDDETADKLVALHSRRISIAYDQDAPGREAAMRVKDMLDRRGQSCRTVKWSRQFGKDVTELVKIAGHNQFVWSASAAWR